MFSVLFLVLVVFKICSVFFFFFFFSSRRRHTRYWRDWSSDVCSSDLAPLQPPSFWLRISCAQPPPLPALLAPPMLRSASQLCVPARSANRQGRRLR